jgi:SAM-dependent methyltransferase
MMEIERIAAKYEATMRMRFGEDCAYGLTGLTTHALATSKALLEERGYRSMNESEFATLPDNEFMRRLGPIENVVPGAHDITADTSLLKEILRLLEASDMRRPHTTADICCGGHTIADFMIAENLIDPVVIGLDPIGYHSTENVPGFNLVYGTPFRLPVRSGSIDLVLLKDVLHFCHGWRRVLSEIVRICKENGMIFISWSRDVGRVTIDPCRVSSALCHGDVDIVRCVYSDPLTGAYRHVISAIKRRPRGGIIIPV